ncbi:MAG: hypothetical protein H6585_09755 [Flavobacteriales bacterium]|nr:hypothetical protein [Flavobacteriales bacterium]MCB9448615.1 hypothetical protein [Flavobacteriales bacterium]
MKYFYNNYVVKDEDAYINGMQGETEQMGAEYASGIPMELGNLDLVYTYGEVQAHKCDWLAGIQFVPLVSEQFRKVVEAHAPGEAEFHPVRIRCEENGKEDTSYSFMNLLNNVRCMDRKKSKLVLFTPGHDVVSDIKKLVLEEKAIGDRHLFRVAEFPSLILFSEPLKEKLEAAGLSGVEWKEASGYSSVLMF